MLEAASYRGRPPNLSKNIRVAYNPPSPTKVSQQEADRDHHVLSPNHRSATLKPYNMPGYTTLSWRDSVRLRKKSSHSISSASTSSELNQSCPWNDENLNSYDPWNTPSTAFPWDPLANGNCTNRLSPTSFYNRQAFEEIQTLSNSKSHLSGVYQRQFLEPQMSTQSNPKSHRSDVCLTLDPKHLIPHNETSKYQPLRDSPTPPKSKKKCVVERSSGLKETRFGPTSYCTDSLQAEISRVNSAQELQRRLSGEVFQPHNAKLKTNLKKMSKESNGHHLANPQFTTKYKCSSKSKSPNGSPSQFNPNSPTTLPNIDRRVFERYYEGSKLGDHGPPSLPGNKDRCSLRKKSNLTKKEDHPNCGGFTPFSLALAIPAKLEGLLKLLAQSLHLVLSGFCSRYCFRFAFVTFTLRKR